MNVFENADDSDHGCWIDSFAQGFVIKADVAASNRNVKFLAGLSDAINHLRELPHDVRLLWIAEIQAIGRAHRSRTRASHVACRIGDGVHRPKLRIEIAPPAVAIERHGEPALRALDADDASIPGARTFNRVGLHHVVVLLPDPTLPADIRTGEQVLQVAREIARFGQLDRCRHLPRHRRLPSFEGTLVHGRIVGKRFVRNFGNNFSVVKHAHLAVTRDAADFDGVESPLLKYAEDFFFAALLRHQQHALLGFAEHDLVWRHAGFALRHAVQFDLGSDVAA